MATKNGHIIAIEKTPGGNRYTVLIHNYNINTKKWQLAKEVVPENVLIYAMVSGKVNILNAEVTANKLHGTTGSLDRFNCGKNTAFRPLVILSELRTDNDQRRLLGYRIANYEGKVKTIRLSEMLAQCDKVVKQAAKTGEALVPIQNAMYIEASGNVVAHIKGYIQNQFIVELIPVTTADNVEKAKVNQAENNKQAAKLDEIFTKEQLHELALGKKNGVNYRLYANKELSAAQMKELRKALQDGLNPRMYADPAFTAEAMRAYRFHQKYRVDISRFINPAYNEGQIFELAAAVIAGVDLRAIANPSYSARTMAKERVDLESKLYAESLVKDSSTLSKLMK